MFGAAFGFAILMKLLCLAYVPASCAALLLVALARDSSARSRWRVFATLLLALPVTMLIIWAGYGFDYGTMLGGSTRLPAPMLLQGMKDLLSTNAQGFQSYAWGSASYAGWWWYFPFAIGLKTTLATLILSGLGLVVAITNRAFQNGAAVSLALLAVAMPTHVNIGVRYVLPIYVPLSVAAAAAFLALVSHHASIARWTGSALIAWHSIAAITTHPHYLAYFNETAGRDPSQYLIDSNLDWGQDVLELGRVLRAEGITSVGILLFGPAKPDALGFPQYTYLQPWTPVSGWVAVSDHAYRMGRTEGQWWWLVGQPYRRVGRSIRLYHLP
jgi:hypothetical protein